MENAMPNPIENATRPLLEKAGFKLLEALVVGKREPIVRLVIYHPNGVSLDDCERATRLLGNSLDDLFVGHYRLEISSPGLERELKSPMELTIFQGRVAKVWLREIVQDHDQLTGTLDGIEGEHVRLRVEEKTLLLPIPLIEKVRLVYH
jgi:ribosome maturation factor RimP